MASSIPVTREEQRLTQVMANYYVKAEQNSAKVRHLSNMDDLYNAAVAKWKKGSLRRLPPANDEKKRAECFGQCNEISSKEPKGPEECVILYLYWYQCKSSDKSLGVYPRFSPVGPERLGSIQAWDVAKKCPGTDPDFVPKMAEIESVFEIGKRNCPLGLACSGHAAMSRLKGFATLALVWVKRTRVKTCSEWMACEGSNTCGRYWSREHCDPSHQAKGMAPCLA